MADDIITRDSQGNLAVNTVASTEANVPYNYDDCFTLDTQGRRALRIVGNGGGGSGAVDSVNGKTGVVVLTGEDISAEVGGETDTIQGHLQTNADAIESVKDQIGNINTALDNINGEVA